MKTTLKILFLCGIIGVMAFSCGKEQPANNKQPKQSDFVEGYVVAFFQCFEVDTATSQATGKVTPRGYCILLEGKQHTKSPWPMDIYTFNLPDSLFNFPQDILSLGYDGGNCGPVFFPNSLQTKYKIKFKYQVLDSTEMMQFTCGACTAMGLAFPWKDYKQVIITDVTQIN